MDDQGWNPHLRYFRVVTETHHAFDVFEQVSDAQSRELPLLAGKAALYDQSLKELLVAIGHLYGRGASQ